MEIIVSTVIKQDDNILMIQEAKKKCYGQWTFPAGHLEEKETIFNAAIREAKEETGYDVKLINLISIQNCIGKNTTLLKITFNAEIISGDISYNEDEILDVKWTPIETIKLMGEKLRGENQILNIIKDIELNKNYPLDVILNMPLI